MHCTSECVALKRGWGSMRCQWKFFEKTSNKRNLCSSNTWETPSYARLNEFCFLLSETLNYVKISCDSPRGEMDEVIFSLSLTFSGEEDTLAQNFELCEELNRYWRSELGLHTSVFFVSLSWWEGVNSTYCKVNRKQLFVCQIPNSSGELWCSVLV